MKVSLVFLPGQLLDDRVFLREFVTNYHRLCGRTLLVHTGTTADSAQLAFMTKRLSGALSEEMVPNAAFSGHQRDFLRRSGDAYLVRRDLLEEVYRLVDCVVLNNLAQCSSGVHAADPLRLLPYLRDQVDCLDCRIFTTNPRSALAAEPRLVCCQHDFDQLMELYEEEAETLKLASATRPAWVVSARNYYDPRILEQV